MAGNKQVAKVRRDVLEACMTCPLCNKLLEEATTISLCLHTFCRKCIYDTLSDDGTDCCPVCDVELGCLPLEKLRPDHNLQDIRAKIFPLKGVKIDPPEVMTSVSPPAKRKERSLSSLVVDAPKVSVQSGFTPRRNKASARKAAGLRGNNFTVDESVDRTPDIIEDRLDSSSSSSSHESLSRVIQNKRQSKDDFLPTDPYNEQGIDEDKENDIETMEGKADLWTPLNCLVEAANRTKSSKLQSQGLSLSKLEQPRAHGGEQLISGTKTGEKLPSIDNEISPSKGKNKENGQSAEFQVDKNCADSQPVPVRRRRLRAAARKAGTVSEELCPSAKAIIDSAGPNGRNSQVWFSLVASEDQKGDAPLPQISAGYLRIRDGQMPVSFVQKYLVKKLDLASESEVEIMCRGQPVMPDQPLSNLIDLWFRTASASKKIPASVGSSAKEFVMVLSYCRKAEGSSNSSKP